MNFTASCLTAIFKRLACLGWALSSLGILGSSTVMADTVVETTRIIYPEAKRDVSFKITNTSKLAPSFVQLWLDDGNSGAAPEESMTPFSLSPPVAKLKAEGSQVVRLVFTGDPLPADKESVFWFNMLEVPPKSKEETRLSFAVRTRIKLFYRPKALKGDPSEWFDKATWRVFKDEKGWMAEITNPSAFHLSFFSISLGNPGKYSIVADGGMVAPKEKGLFLLPGTDKMDKLDMKTLRIEYVNDYGGPTTREVKFTN
jgi:P pilus assembly chaperone PapD